MVVAESDLAPLLDAFLATGASLGEALGLVAKTVGRDAALSRLVAELRNAPGEWKAFDAAIDLLDAVAVADPALAQLGLEAWGRHRNIAEGVDLSGSRWVQTLPEGTVFDGSLIIENIPVQDNLPDGLAVGGELILEGTDRKDLPEGLRVGKNLDLNGSLLRTLPKGLKVGGNLDLGGCRDWDGLIPEDAAIGGEIFAPSAAKGLTLAQWRQRHSEGRRW
jgi:hypothetical protein